MQNIPQQVGPEEDAFAPQLPTEALANGDIVGVEEAAEPVGSADIERLALRVGGLNLLCAPKMGREVVTFPAVNRLPHTPMWLLGVASVRGAFIPVMDLAVAFELERDVQTRPYLLISGVGEDAIGFVVEDLPTLVHLDPSDKIGAIPPHPTILKGCISAAFSSGGILWYDWDVEAFLETIPSIIGVPRK